jgi:hypothetical protein
LNGIALRFCLNAFNLFFLTFKTATAFNHWQGPGIKVGLLTDIFRTFARHPVDE